MFIRTTQLKGFTTERPSEKLCTSFPEEQVKEIFEKATADISMQRVSSFPAVMPEGFYIDNPLLLLKEQLSVVAPMLPANAIVQFDPTRATLSTLNLLFDQIGKAFYFDREVVEIYTKYKNHPPHEIGVPLPGETLQARAEACNELIQAIFPRMPAIYDTNLKIFWKKLVVKENWNPDLLYLTAEEIRTFIQDPQNRHLIESVTFINFIGMESIKILPPEINMFPNLRSISLLDSGIVDHPYVLEAHPQAKNLIIEENERNLLFSPSIS